MVIRQNIFYFIASIRSLPVKFSRFQNISGRLIIICPGSAPGALPSLATIL
jgi:hypothetical protein